MEVCPSGKQLAQLWKITMLLVAKLTISMAMFNSSGKLPEGNTPKQGDVYYLVVMRERFGAFGVPIFLIYTLFNGVPFGATN